jgi:hypothetical protein
MKRMNNQDELNFRRFEEIYPVYRDMGRKVKAEFQKAKEIDLFNTKEIQSQAKEIEGLREWKDKAIKLIEPSIEQSKGVLEDCDSEYWSDRANKIIDEGKELLKEVK